MVGTNHKQNKTEQNKTKQKKNKTLNKSKQNKTKQNRTKLIKHVQHYCHPTEATERRSRQDDFL